MSLPSQEAREWHWAKVLCLTKVGSRSLKLLEKDIQLLAILILYILEILSVKKDQSPVDTPRMPSILNFDYKHILNIL